MVSSKAKTVSDYLQSLPADRRGPIRKVRDLILKNLPRGYVETMNWGMISYEIPLERFPHTYNKQPLNLAGLASQKNYMTIYLMNVYADPKTTKWFHERYKASGKKLKMGKSCVYFNKIEDLPLDLIGEAVALCSVEEYIERYERIKKKD